MPLCSENLPWLSPMLIEKKFTPSELQVNWPWIPLEEPLNSTWRQLSSFANPSDAVCAHWVGDCSPFTAPLWESRDCVPLWVQGRHFLCTPNAIYCFAWNTAIYFFKSTAKGALLYCLSRLGVELWVFEQTPPVRAPAMTILLPESWFILLQNVLLFRFYTFFS